MAKRTVILLGNDIVTQNEDDKAAVAITPGMLVTFNGSGDLIPHGVAAGNAQRAFALEREEAGQDMDVAYVVGETVKVGVCPRGVRVNALVATGAPAIAKGDFLESAGNGTLRKVVTAAATADTSREAVVGLALEALTNTSGANARLRVEVL